MQPSCFRARTFLCFSAEKPITNSKTQSLKGSTMRNLVSMFVCYSLVTIREKVSTITARKDWRTAFERIPGIVLVLLVCLAVLPGRAAAAVFRSEERRGGK